MRLEYDKIASQGAREGGERERGLHGSEHRFLRKRKRDRVGERERKRDRERENTS